MKKEMATEILSLKFDLSPKVFVPNSKNAPTPKTFFSLGFLQGNPAGKKTKKQTHFAELGFRRHLPGGLAPLVTGLCFLLAIPFAPVVSAVPPLASGPILCLLGALMCSSVRGIDWDDYQELKKQSLEDVNSDSTN